MVIIRWSLVWPDAEKILRQQTIEHMLGKITPHATARDFAETYTYIFTKDQEKAQCLFPA